MPTVIKSAEEILKLIDEIFLLPPKIKSELKEIFPMMPDSEKAEFLSYLDSIIQKQDEVLEYLVKNNPDFIQELKRFGRISDVKKLKRLEKETDTQEEMDMVALEEALKKL